MNIGPWPCRLPPRVLSAVNNAIMRLMQKGDAAPQGWVILAAWVTIASLLRAGT